MKKSIGIGLISASSFIMLAAFSVVFSWNAQAAPFPSHLTNTPSPTPTVTPTPLLKDLYKQIIFGGVGGGGGDMPCGEEVLRKLRTIPGVISLGRDKNNSLERYASHYLNLCIFGMPFRNGFNIVLYQPDGKKAGSGTFLLREDDESTTWYLRKTKPDKRDYAGIATYVNGTPAIYLRLWMPAGLPDGDWYASLTATRSKVGSYFDVPPYFTEPIVGMGRKPVYYFPKANPLENPDEIYYSKESTQPKAPGSTYRIYGDFFEPGSSTPIGLYLVNDEELDGTLIDQIRIKADRKGSWQFKYEIPAGLPPGSYALVVGINPYESVVSVIGPSYYYTTDEWQPCRDTYASRLAAGMKARVIKGQAANRIRSQPTTSSNNVIGRLPAGEVFEVLGNPRCNGGWVWWYIETQDGYRGWTSEGDQTDRWLEPVE